MRLAGSRIKTTLPIVAAVLLLGACGRSETEQPATPVTTVPTAPAQTAPPATSPPTTVPEAAAEEKPELYSKDEVLDLVAPVALYPDVVLASMLPATTFPDEVHQAALWLAEEGSQADEVPVERGWDLNVQALCQFPEVVDWLDENDDWREQMAYAMTYQQGDVLDAVQDFRLASKKAGRLESNAYQVVEVQEPPASAEPGAQQTVRIDSAKPDVVYVPQYDPVVATQPVATAAAPATSTWMNFGTGLLVGGLGAWAISSLWDDDDDGGYHHGGKHVKVNNTYNYYGGGGRPRPGGRPPGWGYGPNRPGAWNPPAYSQRPGKPGRPGYGGRQPIARPTPYKPTTRPQRRPGDGGLRPPSRPGGGARPPGPVTSPRPAQRPGGGKPDRPLTKPPTGGKPGRPTTRPAPAIDRTSGPAAKNQSSRGKQSLDRQASPQKPKRAQQPRPQQPARPAQAARPQQPRPKQQSAMSPRGGGGAARQQAQRGRGSTGGGGHRGGGGGRKGGGGGRKR